MEKVIIVCNIKANEFENTPIYKLMLKISLVWYPYLFRQGHW